VLATERMANYRRRMRAAGLKLVQIWVPDTHSPAFVKQCRAQSRAIARHDEAGDEALRFIEATYEWPKP
jgi:hypothetical protein